MGQAALQYVRRGWPVFPCRERDEHWVNAAKKAGVFKAKAPYGGKGLKDATCDEARIVAWWKQHPDAMIGVPMGVNGCFALDFDPRVEEDVDPETGEVTGTREFTLEQLKAELEAMLGVALPPSLTAITQSGGVHVWYRQPDDGEAPIRNRGNLPDHVDVRGEGGYVVGPPSLIYDDDGAEKGRYRWLGRSGDWRDDAAIAAAPAELIAVLRARKQRVAAPAAPRPAAGDPSAALAQADDDVRKYALVALDGECREIREAPSGRRNAQLNTSALKVASLVAAGALEASLARAMVESAARANPGDDDDRQLIATIDSGWTAGLASPRDLSEIAAAARSRRERGNRAGPPRARAAPRPAPAAPGDAKETEPFRGGRADGLPILGVAEVERFKRASAAWFERRCEHVELAKAAIERLAFSAGRRIAGGLLDETAVKEALWDLYGEHVADVQHADIDRAIGDGIARGFDPEPLLLAMKCSGYPLTAFGMAERFRDRFGMNFRFTTATGWLGWDERRWKVLDQDEKTPPAEVIGAVWDTVRAVQEEARLVADTGVRWGLVTEGKQKRLDLQEGNPHGLDKWIPKGKDFELLSSKIAVFGRQSETSGQPASIALLARRWLTLPFAAFDNDPYALNVMNGTLRFSRETLPDDTVIARVEIEPHSREQLNTKLSPVEYDPDATCPLYDGMFEWAQPLPAMRRYLHQVGGYAMTGDPGEQKLWFWYGRGRNGKGVTIESWSHVTGDYGDSIPIESFTEQAIKKRGDSASPDLAKLGGVRLLRASEPGRNERLNTGLIKFVTGGEPVPVRNLHRGFFNLVPKFKLIISGNTKFDIPDTDDGIWGRLKLVSWLRNIDHPPPNSEGWWPKKDLHLVSKIKAREGPGVLNRLIEGLLDYMTNGLIEPSEVTEATTAYREGSDPLARFLKLCVVEDAESSVPSSRLHDVFVAWCKAAGEKEWSNKGFSKALEEKGFEKHRSDGMKWRGLRLVKDVGDFVGEDGKVRSGGADPGMLDDARAPPEDYGPVPGFDDLPP
jgi:putative DNA primase/helicase